MIKTNLSRLNLLTGKTLCKKGYNCPILLKCPDFHTLDQSVAAFIDTLES